jgi:hypothetical protein
MLVRDGSKWRIDGRVRVDSDFFTVFVTPHWNEALNPNTYIPLVDTVVRSMLERRCAAVVDWYRDERGRRRDRQQFAALARELATFYGEPYGHQDDGEQTVSIANTCFPGGETVDASSAGSARGGTQPTPVPRPSVWSAAPAWPGADQLGRTELWWAARDGQLAAVERLLAQVENPNAQDIDGEGPLHAAARGGHVTVVEVLLASGADPGAKAVHGGTPLHAAIDQSQAGAALALLRKGADVNARDAFGRTPLHQAVSQGNRELAAILLDHGADSAVLYAGRTPAQLAARGGDQAFADWLGAYRPTRVARSTPAPEVQPRPKDYVPLPRMPAKPAPRVAALPG